MAENLSIQQLQQSIQDGVLPSYIGVPLLKSKVEDAKLLQAAKAAQAMSQQPSVAQQIMSQAQQVAQPQAAPQMQQAGVPALQSNLPTSMAGGGIVAFADGGMYDEDDTDEDRQDAERKAEMEAMMDEYAQTFQQGIGSLPAAASAAPSAPSGRQSAPENEDTSDFIARIMQKESRGQRYGRDGQLLTSPKGAQGEMQVMPGTSRDPGYGVKAARDGSPDELARVGRDYASALLERYGDPKLAAIAYNMGPGATDKWLAAGADPSKLPKETQGYVKGFSGEDGESEVKDKYKGLWPYNSPDAGKFTYSKYQPKEKDERESEMMRAVKTPFRAIGRGLESLYSNKAGMPSQEDYTSSGDLSGAIMGERNPTAAPAQTNQKPYDFTQFDAATDRYMNDRDQSRLEAARKNELNLRDKVAADKKTQGETAPVVAPSSAVDAAAPAKPDPYAKFEEIFARREENLGKQREQDKYMAMLQAGLGMMGGTSRNALANIGAGGQQGIQALAQSNAARTTEENALLSGRLGLAKIGSNKEYQDAMMAYRKDLAERTDTRARDLAKDVGAQKTEDRALREKKEYADQLADMRKDATTRMLANMKGQIIPGQEAVIEARALEALKSDPDYIDLYKKVYGRNPSGGKMSGGYGEPPAGAVKKI
jgi:soluble lytic murein transglycosylase-like protein